MVRDQSKEWNSFLCSTIYSKSWVDGYGLLREILLCRFCVCVFFLLLFYFILFLFLFLLLFGTRKNQISSRCCIIILRYCISFQYKIIHILLGNIADFLWTLETFGYPSISQLIDREKCSNGILKNSLISSLTPNAKKYLRLITHTSHCQ